MLALPAQEHKNYDSEVSDLRYIAVSQQDTILRHPQNDRIRFVVIPNAMDTEQSLFHDRCIVYHTASDVGY